MGVALLTFVAIFVVALSIGVVIASRSEATARLSAAIAEGDQENWLGRLKSRGAGDSIRAIFEPFNRILPKTAQEVSVAQKRLIRAGYREEGHLRIFHGSKVVVPIAAAIFVAVSGTTEYIAPFMAYISALGLGYLAPDFWLGNRIKKRQTEIRLSLPDFLDILVVCVEAGLSMDQALAKTSSELKVSHPEISDETGLLILEQRSGLPRAEAWRNLAERVDLEAVRTLVTSIIQADQFGTSISKTLRIYSEGLRTRRRQEVEEKAAKTAIKLVFPLVFFIFPALFVVALGPSLLAMADAVDKYLR
jgi:tight adherence protein C